MKYYNIQFTLTPNTVAKEFGRREIDKQKIRDKVEEFLYAEFGIMPSQVICFITDGKLQNDYLANKEIINAQQS